jgi:hypothetical protein
MLRWQYLGPARSDSVLASNNGLDQARLIQVCCCPAESVSKDRVFATWEALGKRRGQFEFSCKQLTKILDKVNAAMKKGIQEWQHNGFVIRDRHLVGSPPAGTRIPERERRWKSALMTWALQSECLGNRPSMDEKNRDDSTKKIPIRALKSEPEAEDLLESAAMEPYMNLAMAIMGKEGHRPGNRGACCTAA